MSNKIVPAVYRSVIDQVVASVRLDFDELAVDEEILALLQQKWESKLLESRVADFEPPAAQHHYQQSYHPMHVPVPTPAQYRNQYQAKTEQQRFGNGQFGGRVGGGLGGGGMPSTSQQQEQWNGGLKGGGAWLADDENGGAMRLRGGAKEKEDEDDSDESSEPSSPRPPKAPTSIIPAAPAGPRVPNENGIFPGDEQINSDLDDSEDELDDDDEAGEGGGDDPNMDIVFCVYDKVQRVKNKWKMVFRDGMGHVNGKDYLFSKCSSDFEW